MIEPLDTEAADSFNPRRMVEKINELVNGYNELHEKLDPLAAIINKESGEVNWRIRDETAS